MNIEQENPWVSAHTYFPNNRQRGIIELFVFVDGDRLEGLNRSRMIIIIAFASGATKRYDAACDSVV